MDLQEIEKIRDQFHNGMWPQFLESVQISGLRGWTGETVSFQFPIVAVAGENGTGKSTVLKAAVCAYENNSNRLLSYPSTFFINTYWDRIQGAALTYRVRRGNDNRTFRITKRSKKWSFPDERYARPVFFFDVSRTLPLDASAGYAKIARLAAGEVGSKTLSPDYRQHLSYILGRTYINARFATPDIDARHDVGIVERDFGEISQFHQGAGEDATLDLIHALQSIPDYSLLVIDEVENSLHPRAQRRLIRFLLWLCRKKRVQILLSTHSPYVLQELPKEARVLLLPGSAGVGVNVLYGSSPEFALSRLDEVDVAELQVFVEDHESEALLREIIASDSQDDLLSRLGFSPVGPANVVAMLGKLGAEKRLPGNSLAVVDGDKDESPGCIRLPGGRSPERTVFEDLRARDWPELPERFGKGAGQLFSSLDDAMLDPNPHRWPELVGDRIRMSSRVVWALMCQQWCKYCLSADERDRIVGEIREQLP